MTSESANPDAQLLAALADGDLGALRTLYEAHAPWLSVRLHRRCRNHELVADVLQDTFTTVWQQARRYRGDGDVGAWLWGISIRKLLTRLRGQDLHEVLVGGSDLPETQRETLEDQVLCAVEYGDLADVLRRLSPEMRAVVQATVLDGLTARETAQLLGLAEGTVKTRLHRAKARMRAELAAQRGGRA